MNTILNRLDRLMMAITFAEANEPELAQEVWSRKPTLHKRAPQSKKITGGQILPSQIAH